MSIEEDIKRQLQELLIEKHVDYSKVIALSNELANYDSNNVRFSVDAGIITRLGEELVGKRDTAVSELIKNSYDADATVVDVIFKGAYWRDGILTIDDNGNGMTREQLINGFMRISSSDKIHNPYSPKYHRTRAGQKGIGRFATQRLGTKLTIITQTEQSLVALKVTIDWNNFSSDKDLLTIGSVIETIEKQKEKGTTLIIEHLCEGWSDAYIKKIYRCVSTLLQPYPLSTTDSKDEDPGFKVSFYRDLKGEQNKIVDEINEIYNFALAEINAYVDDQGQGHWSLKSRHFDYEQSFLIGNDSEDESIPFKQVRGVHARIYYFIYESSLLSGQKLKDIKAVASEFGGVRLYRKGFRVLPYGEKGDDWLGLDESVRKRTVVAPHQNQSFFGLVEIEGEGVNIFQETSSREGLIENEAYDELVGFLYRVIIAAVLKVADLRGRKGSANQKDWQKRNSTVKVDAALDDLKSILEDLRNGENHEPKEGYSVFYEKAKTIIETILLARGEEKDAHQKLIDELNMMRILSGTGLVIGEFVHEIKRFLPMFSVDINYIRQHIAKNPEEKERVDSLSSSLNSFSAYTSYFDRTISKNVIRELEPINLREQVNTFKGIIENDLLRAHIVFMPPIYEYIDLTTIPMHPSEWASILFNLYTNSKKAIKKANLPDKRILVKCGKVNENLYLEFSDTGIGIPVADWGNVFNAFFTTSSPVGSKDDMLSGNSGTGLGLKIVRDILTSYNGTISVVSPADSYSTTFRIEIPYYKR